MRGCKSLIARASFIRPEASPTALRASSFRLRSLYPAAISSPETSRGAPCCFGTNGRNRRTAGRVSFSSFFDAIQGFRPGLRVPGGQAMGRRTSRAIPAGDCGRVVTSESDKFCEHEAATPLTCDRAERPTTEGRLDDLSPQSFCSSTGTGECRKAPTGGRAGKTHSPARGGSIPSTSISLSCDHPLPGKTDGQHAAVIATAGVVACPPFACRFERPTSWQRAGPMPLGPRSERAESVSTRCQGQSHNQLRLEACDMHPRHSMNPANSGTRFDGEPAPAACGKLGLAARQVLDCQRKTDRGF